MRTDEYGCVLNGPETYNGIAALLREHGSCIVPWTDEEGTQFDILFNVFRVPEQMVSHGLGLIQGGLNSRDLFISIMRVGAFAFEREKTDTHASYYAEKLRIPAGGHTSEKLAELFNQVKLSLMILRRM